MMLLDYNIIITLEPLMMLCQYSFNPAENVDLRHLVKNTIVMQFVKILQSVMNAGTK